MPKFSTHFPFIKSGKPRTPGTTRGNTPAPDNPAPASTASDGAATLAVVAPQVSPSPAVNVAPPTSADPQANVAVPVNTAESQDVPCQIATDDPAKAVASLLTPEAMHVNSPEPGDSTGNIAAGNVVMRAIVAPQVSTPLAINIESPSAGPQGNTALPVNVADHTADPPLTPTGVTLAGVARLQQAAGGAGERSPKLRPASTTQVEDVPKVQITQSKGWKLMKESLKAVKELSDAFMPLKTTLSAILLVTDYVEVRGIQCSYYSRKC